MTGLPPTQVLWSSPALERIARLVGDRAGLVFSYPRHRTVEATIRREASRAGHRDLFMYYDALSADRSAIDALAAELTIGETYFFRDSTQFELLRDRILPDIAASRGSAEIRIWSAGCASGEEPYSVAIVCSELGLAGRTSIVGTDLARERLLAAREARFGRWSLRGVPDTVVNTYFSRRDTRFDLAAAIREMVDFRYLNLAVLGQPAAPPAPMQMDLILCRNVLIYFDADCTSRVMRQLVDSLSPDGWLLLGASDPPPTDYVDCEVIVTRAGLAYRRVAESRPRPVAPYVPVETVVWEAPAALPIVRDQDAPVEARASETPHDAEESQRDLLARAVEAHAHGRDAESAELAREFIERGGDELTAWVLRVRVLANTGLMAEAGQTCSRALERHPLSAELTYLQAVLLAHAGRHEEAVGAARRALYLDRTLAVAHLALGDALARLGRGDEAARAFRSAQRMLARLGPEALVPASGGERSARLSAAASARLKLMELAS